VSGTCSTYKEARKVLQKSQREGTFGDQGTDVRIIL
jgi:hypothetical protein